MEEAIRNFHKQFSWQPQVRNVDKLKKTDKFIVSGMGGSHLSADLLKVSDPYLDLLVYSNYGLPRVPGYFLNESLVIFSSYSGNTEEPLDGLEQALKAGLSVAVVASGGRLLERAQETGIPFVQIPATGIQPRLALGYSTLTLLELMDLKDRKEEIISLADTFDPNMFEDEGKALAESLLGRVPVIYSSAINRAISYNWKIKFNETGKIPAFYNIFPELNHNEMTGFDLAFVGESRNDREKLNDKFAVLMLKDDVDHERIQKRMDITEELYKSKNVPVHIIKLDGVSVWEKIFSSLLLADWTAFYIAQHYGSEAEQVPMVEELKKLLRE